MKKGRDLLDHSRLIEVHPELLPLFEGPHAEFRKLIFRKRMEKDWTQNELAKNAYVDIMYISRIEGSTAVPKEITLKIIQALDITVAELAHIDLNKL